MYTKGDWKAEHIGNEGKYVIHTGDLSLPFAHTFPNRYRNPQVSSEEAEANARLIAQAPKLYEALKGYMMLCGNTAYQVDREGLQHYRELAQKAIAPVEEKC